jgi:hypothetical protein
MKVIVKFQRHVRPQIQDWMRTLGQRADDRRRIGRVSLEGMIYHLQQNNGVPPEAIREAGIEPPTYWWRFTSGYWVRFCVEEQGGRIARFLGRQVKKVTILNLGTNPPNRVN